MRKRERERKGNERNRDRREQNREQSADGNEEHGEPAASRFSKVRCFFPVFVPGSRDVSPSTDSTRPTLKCFGRSSKLVPCFSLYSSFFFPALVSLFLSPCPPLSLLLPFSSFLPLCSSALSHLSGVSTSISKKSSRELFVGKCREPAVRRTG